MKLNMIERAVTQTLLPEKEDFSNMKMIREARESLSYTEKENADWQIVNHPDGRMVWRADLDIDLTEKTIKLGEYSTSLIVKELKRLNESSTLENRHLTLYEKFIEDMKPEVH